MSHASRKSLRLPVCLLSFIACLGFALTGCQTGKVVPVNGSASAKLERETSIYIVTPDDGHYGEIKYPESGASVTNAFEAALARYVKNVVIGGSVETTADALEVAKMKRCTYLIVPKITRWEDRATDRSGIRDKRELFVRVIRVEDGVELRSAEIKGKSSWTTFGGDRPQDLLKEPLTEFVNALF